MRISGWLAARLWLVSSWPAASLRLSNLWLVADKPLASRCLAAENTKTLQFWPAPDQVLYSAPELETRQSGLALASAMKFSHTGSISFNSGHKIRCRVICEMPNSKKQRGMDKPGFSSALWATEAIFAGVLVRRARVRFFNYTIAGREDASQRPWKLLTLRTVLAKFSPFF